MDALEVPAKRGPTKEARPHEKRNAEISNWCSTELARRLTFPRVRNNIDQIL